MCGCSKNKRNVGRKVITSPSVRSTPGLQATQTPRQLQLRVQALNQESSSDTSGMTKEMRDKERRRRAAIARRTFGK